MANSFRRTYKRGPPRGKDLEDSFASTPLQAQLDTRKAIPPTLALLEPMSSLPDNYYFFSRLYEYLSDTLESIEARIEYLRKRKIHSCQDQSPLRGGAQSDD